MVGRFTGDGLKYSLQHAASGKGAKSGKLLLPQRVDVGSCNVYMCVTPEPGASVASLQLQVTLEVAGGKVEGMKARELATSHKDEWEEIWNCAFLSTGNYTVNLNYSKKDLSSDHYGHVTPISTITHDTTVTNRFTQALYPILHLSISAQIALSDWRTLIHK